MSHVGFSHVLKQIFEHVFLGRASLIKEQVGFSSDLFPDSVFLIGCTNGLFLYCKGNLYRLAKGKFYGITVHQGRWYAYRKVDRYIGQILSFCFKEDDIADLRLERSFLPRTIHQIDVIENELYVIDTLNSVLKYSFAPKGLQKVKKIQVNGSLKDGKNSPNYCHVNSIFHDGHNMYLMYHNTTSKTGKLSQIALFDTEFKERDILEVNGHDAHNISKWGDSLIYCDSGHRSLVWGDRVVEVDKMTRGLAISCDLVLLGGSAFAQRKDRQQTTGKIYFLSTRSLELNGTMEIPASGQIQEIRFVDRPDYGLSSTEKPEFVCREHVYS